MLSLRGYDSNADFHSITLGKHAGAELKWPILAAVCCSRNQPELCHTKAGLRLDTNSRDYEILAQWIANGAAAPSEDDALIEKITVTPENAKLHPEDYSQVLVTAHVRRWHLEGRDSLVAIHPPPMKRSRGWMKPGRVQINGSGEGQSGVGLVCQQGRFGKNDGAPIRIRLRRRFTRQHTSSQFYRRPESAAASNTSVATVCSMR